MYIKYRDKCMIKLRLTQASIAPPSKSQFSVSGNQIPQCIVCGVTLSNKLMVLNKFKKTYTTNHSLK